MLWVNGFLEQVREQRKQHFRESRWIMSFGEYLKEVFEEPATHLRSSAQYFSDMIESFGEYKVNNGAKSCVRYRLFDAEYAEKRGKLFGQEQVVLDIVRHLKNFVNAGRIDKLLLLHGPNGSAKTTIAQALMSAAEEYSKSKEGAIYQFSWVFPKKERLSGGLGFSKNSSENIDTFAYLRGEEVDAVLPSEQAEHPILLLSAKERRSFFSQIEDQGRKLKIPNILSQGDLSLRNRQIFDALFSAYGGDISAVFRHVRVERFNFSRRYKKGISVVEPQMSVDVYVRQLTNDQSLSQLPGSLKYLNLYETMGALVDANRGMIEYSDLLKRPIDAWKYLLIACEQAQVSTGNLLLYFDLLMLATSNDLHLASFKEYPDWPSFKGRIELIKVPYLLKSKEEEGIYLNQIPEALNGMHIAPHSIALAARWGVLTRLEPPMVQKYPNEMQEIIRDLSPEEKLALYEEGEVPARLSQRQGKELKYLIPSLIHEYDNEVNYEGRFGASPREIKTLILNAAQDARFSFLCPQAVLDQIELLIEQKSSYEFLRRETVRGYRDAKALLDSVKKFYLEKLEDEARTALGLFAQGSYDDLFSRYVAHVSAWIKKERLVDSVSGKTIDADEHFMQKIESKFLATNESNDDFRRQLISQIAAFRLENPSSELDYGRIFSSHFRKIKESVYQEQKGVLERVIEDFLKYTQSEDDGLNEKDRSRAQKLLDGFIKLGYTEASAQWAMLFYMKNAQRKVNIGQASLNI